MKAIGVLPARWGSTRLPGKVLINIAGKPMLQHVWERVKRCHSLSTVVIACDEKHVFDCAKSFGAEVVMTKKDHPSGSDRVAEAIAHYDSDIVVNIQADEPLIEPDLIDDLVQVLSKEPQAVISTAVQRCVSIEDFLNPNVVKVVLNQKKEALYFSRAPIPFKRDGDLVAEDVKNFFRHLGIYAYRREFLVEYCSWPKSFLEDQEKLEQLRVLEAGYRIKTVETSMHSIGVDTIEDVAKVEEYLKKTLNS